MGVWKSKEKTKDGRCWYYDTTIDGKRYKSKKYLTQKEAKAAERELFDNANKLGNQSMMTLGDLFDAHMNFQKDKVKATTLSNYVKRAKHFEPIINIKLNKLNIMDIEKWKQEINSKNYATRTKNDLMKYLKSTLNFGTKWYDFNFTSMYNKLENFNNPNALPKEMEYYTYEEFKQFISAENDIRFRALFETLYYCGLRRGELRGLKWEYVDFDKHNLRIALNVVNISGDGGKWCISTPKTKTSNRTIPIPDILYDDLKKYKEECKRYYGFNEQWFVFGDVDPIHPDIIRRRKNDIAKVANVKQIRIHDFRHSCASLLINNGANVVMVAKYLGHSKIDETLNTYAHVFQSKLDDIVNTINNLQ